MQANDLKRLRLIPINNDILTTILSRGFEVGLDKLETYSTDLPKDVVIVDAYRDVVTDTIILKCWHQSFEVVEEGKDVPKVYLNMKAHVFKLTEGLS